MKKHLNRLLSLLLCLSFVFSLLPVMAEPQADMLRFRVENGEATLIGADFDISGDVVIPAEYQGYPVTAIAAYALSDEHCVRSITIPHTVTSIHREAFMCFDLEALRVEEGNPAYCADSRGVLYNKDKTVLLRAPLKLSGSYAVPAGVTAIGEYAFHLCFELTEVTLPEGLTHIGQRAFDACNKLDAICLPESLLDIGVYAFSGCSGFTYNTYENTKYLGTAANPYYALVETVSMTITTAMIHPDTKLISGAAFRKCDELEEVTLPDGVLYICTWAFAGCNTLTGLQLPSTLRMIGDDAFSGAGLTAITIPEGVQSIGSGAFQGCTKLTAVTLPESLTSIGKNAFAETVLTEIRLGANVSEIEEGAFSDCTALSSIWVEESNAWYSSDSYGVLFSKDKTTLVCAPRMLSGSYQIPDEVTRIESYAFYRCLELSELTLPENVVYIGEYAFYNCYGLTALERIEKVTYLGEYAFAYCHDLNTASIPEGITELPTGLFYGTALSTVSLPEGLTAIGTEAFRGCEWLKEIQIPAGVNSIGEGAFRACHDLQTVTVPEGVAFIGAYAFYSCSGLIRVSVPDSIRRVGVQAFGNCPELVYGYTLGPSGRYVGNEENPYLVFLSVNDDEIERIVMDENTKVVADSALASCCELRSVTLPEGLLTIGSMSFYCCESLPGFTIPNTVTYIGDSAFQRCRFTELLIPASVSEIGDRVFCENQRLTTLRFGGALPVMGQDAFEEITATAYCHREGNADRMKNYGGNITWAEGHVFVNYLLDDGFDCTVGGTKTAKCEGCDATDTVTVTETTEHRYEKGQCTVCGKADPNVCFLTGTLTSSGDGDTLLSLLQNGEIADNLTVSGNTFIWDGLQPGGYILTVAKDNHTTYRMSVTVVPGENVLNLTLCRPGDVVGIGDLNIGDVAQIYAHVRSTSVLTGYALDCADFNGDGNVNVGDVAGLYAKIKDVSEIM